MTQCKKVGFKILSPLLCFTQKETSPPNHHFTAVLNKSIESVEHTELLGTPLVNCQHVHPEGSLHSSQFENLIHHDLRSCIALQSDLNAGIICRKVTHPRDVDQYLFTNEFGNSHLKGRTVHPMRHLPNHDLAGPGLTFRDLHDTTHLDAAASRSEIVVDPLVSANLTRRGKIRPLDVFLDFINRDIRIIDARTDAIDYLSHIVGRNISSHSHRYSSSTIY